MELNTVRKLHVICWNIFMAREGTYGLSICTDCMIARLAHELTRFVKSCIRSVNCISLVGVFSWQERYIHFVGPY